MQYCLCLEYFRLARPVIAIATTGSDQNSCNHLGSEEGLVDFTVPTKEGDGGILVSGCPCMHQSVRQEPCMLGF